MNSHAEKALFIIQYVDRGPGTPHLLLTPRDSRAIRSRSSSEPISAQAPSGSEEQKVGKQELSQATRVSVRFFPRCRQMCRENHFRGNLMNYVHRSSEFAWPKHMGPWAVEASPADHALSQILLFNIISTLRGRRYDRHHRE